MSLKQLIISRSPTDPCERRAAGPSLAHPVGCFLQAPPPGACRKGAWIGLLLLASAGAGCSHPEPYLRRHQVEPGLVLIPMDQVDRWRTVRQEGQPVAASAVEYPGVVLAYPMARRVDPREPDILHEAHTIYRRESLPQWRIESPQQSEPRTTPPTQP